MRKHAFVRENFIVKIESIDEETYLAEIPMYQNIVDIEDLAVQPDIGWLLSGNHFIVNPVTPLSAVEYVKKYIYKPAAKFCAELKESFISENIAMGITASGKTEAVTTALEAVNKYISDVSLYQVLTAIDNVVIVPELSPFVTTNRLKVFKNQILTYLGLPTVP